MRLTCNPGRFLQVEAQSIVIAPNNDAATDALVMPLVMIGDGRSIEADARVLAELLRSTMAEGPEMADGRLPVVIGGRGVRLTVEVL